MLMRADDRLAFNVWRLGFGVWGCLVPDPCELFEILFAKKEFQIILVTHT